MNLSQLFRLGYCSRSESVLQDSLTHCSGSLFMLLPFPPVGQLSRGFLKPFVLDSCSCAGTVSLRWSPGNSTAHPLFSSYTLWPSCKRQCLQLYQVPDWEIVPNFNPMAPAALFREREICWTTLPGAAVSPRSRMHCCEETAVCRFGVVLFMGA